jgi:hypothetical protein
MLQVVHIGQLEKKIEEAEPDTMKIWKGKHCVLDGDCTLRGDGAPGRLTWALLTAPSSQRFAVRFTPKNKDLCKTSSLWAFHHPPQMELWLGVCPLDRSDYGVSMKFETGNNIVESEGRGTLKYSGGAVTMYYTKKPFSVRFQSADGFCDLDVSKLNKDDNHLPYISSYSAFEIKVADVAMPPQVEKLALDVLHAERLFTDASVVAGDEKISVHRAIMAAGSPVMRAMFESGFKEGSEAQIVLTDIDVKTAHALVDFLYGKQPPMEVDTVSLFNAAMYYDIRALQEVLVERMEKNSSPESLVTAMRGLKGFTEDRNGQAAYFRLRKVWHRRYMQGTTAEREAMLDACEI